MATIRNLASRIPQLTDNANVSEFAKEIGKLADGLLSRYRAQDGVRATAWRVAPDVYIQEAGYEDGQFSYRIVSGANELSHQGEWSIPLSPSQRDRDDLCNHRWGSYDEALMAFRSLKA